MAVTTVNGLLHYHSLGHWLNATPLVRDARAILYLAEDEREIKNLSDSLYLWQKLFFTKRLNYLWTESGDLGIISAVTNRQPTLIIGLTSSWLAPLPTKKIWSAACTALTVDQELQPRNLVASLMEVGYQPNVLVNQPGEIAQRGNLIDIGLASAVIRLEFVGNKLEAISQISYSDQQTLKTNNQIVIPPRTLTADEATISDYLTADCLVISKTNFNQDRQILLTDFHKHPDEIYKQQWPDFNRTSFTNNWLKLANYKNSQIYWFSQNPDIANKLLTEHKIAATVIAIDRNLLQTPPSFLDTEKKILALNDNYFFPAEAESNKKKSFLPEINPGDFIVHRDHGVGRLREINTLIVDGLPKDYLILDYAQGDKIYLPTDQAAKISKYVGPAEPKISRLSADQSWILTLQKIKQDTWNLALSILNNEAKRRLTRAEPLLPQKDEAQVAADFPYQETPSQAQAVADSLSDLTQDYPTDRLICGDVGFGKTEVALRAAWRTVLNKGQVAILCPTTILAQQHFDLFNGRLGSHGAAIGLLSRWQSIKEQTATLKKIAHSQIDVVIGTHRALSHDVRFANLKLLIIDEEQNFGVKDKEKLKKIAGHIHILTLSATPIPRTLHLALSPLKSISLLTDPPTGRKPIITEVLPWNESTVVTALNQELARGGQVYYLHNKVETIELAREQVQRLVPQARLAVAHGQLDDHKLATTMHRFDNREIDVLICSTIIANGLDLPNVNTIIITEADHFGLSQLHQLRGRVGRGDRQAYAYLLYSKQKLTDLAVERLKTLQSASDLGAGFQIASRDMELRGVGQLLGNRQHGHLKTLGLNLYEELLASTVADLQNGPGLQWREIDIELPLPQSASDNYFDNDQAKIYFWQRVAMIRTREEIAQAQEQYRDAPQAVHNILYTQELRLLAQTTTVHSITFRRLPEPDDYWLEINFLTTPQVSELRKLLATQPDWLWQQNKLKIKKSQLDRWQNFLRQSVILLESS